jgi:hypothetical protein
MSYLWLVRDGDKVQGCPCLVPMAKNLLNFWPQRIACELRLEGRPLERLHANRRACLLYKRSIGVVFVHIRTIINGFVRQPKRRDVRRQWSRLQLSASARGASGVPLTPVSSSSGRIPRLLTKLTKVPGASKIRVTFSSDIEANLRSDRNFASMQS